MVHEWVMVSLVSHWYSGKRMRIIDRARQKVNVSCEWGTFELAATVEWWQSNGVEADDVVRRTRSHELWQMLCVDCLWLDGTVCETGEQQQRQFSEAKSDTVHAHLTGRMNFEMECGLAIGVCWWLGNWHLLPSFPKGPAHTIDMLSTPTVPAFSTMGKRHSWHSDPLNERADTFKEPGRPYRSPVLIFSRVSAPSIAPGYRRVCCPQSAKQFRS